jgi:aldose 1-epimerase
MSSAPALNLAAGALEAVFWPDLGMLCASFRHRGVELLRRVEDLDSARSKGSTAGIPFLYPWANRLAGLQYKVAGRDVTLNRASPLLHFDEHGLPMHGVPWSKLRWEVTVASQERVSARLPWSSKELVDIFPFPHDVVMNVHIGPGALTFETTVSAGSESVVPISFGFHPYFGIPGVPRSEWKLRLPSMQRLSLNAQGIPTGGGKPFSASDAPLGATSYDDGFALAEDTAVFAISGAGYEIRIEFLQGFRFAQVFAPAQKELVALEPMTAPSNALVSGENLVLLQPGEKYRGSFRVSVEKTGDKQ